MTEIIKHTSLADFLLDENGQLICSLNIDFTEFDVDVQQYLKGDDEITEQEYELIYNTVAQKCNESGEYIIDCFNERYTVRKISEIEQIHYEAMSDEEKIEYDQYKEAIERNERIIKLKTKLSETDYIVIKIAEGEATAEEYANVIAQRKAWRAEIRELEAKVEESSEAEVVVSNLENTTKEID